MKKASLILVEGRQAVLLPDEFRFEGSEVLVRRDPRTGDVILSAKQHSWEAFDEIVRQTEVPADFMEDRQQGSVTRDPFEGWIEPAGEGKVTDDLHIARGTRTAAFVQADATMALEGFARTPKFDRVRQAVIDGKMSFDEAVKEIIASLDLDAGRAQTAPGGDKR